MERGLLTGPPPKSTAPEYIPVMTTLLLESVATFNPILLDATDAGLLLAGGAPQRSETATRAVLVPWEDIRNVQVLGPAQEAAGA